MDGVTALLITLPRGGGDLPPVGAVGLRYYGNAREDTLS